MLLLVLFAVSLVAMVFWLRSKERRLKKAPPKPRSEVEQWIEEALARELGRRLELEDVAVLGAFRGDPDADVVSAIEGVVRGVRVAYERLPHGDQRYEVRAEIAFEDGSSAAGKATFDAAKLPESVREELARTGATFVFRAYAFPWSGADRGWSN